MPALSDRLDHVLNEARMLLLGGQVLLGFSYRICFEKRFEKIPISAQVAEVIALGVMTLALGWLMWPAAFHQIAEAGALSERTHRLTSFVLDCGLFPLATGLGLALYPVSIALRVPHAWIVTALVFLVAVTAWY